MIHNGIIENYHALTENTTWKENFTPDGYTEVAAATLNEIYNETRSRRSENFKTSWKASYAFCIMFEDRPGEILCGEKRKSARSGLHGFRRRDRLRPDRTSPVLKEILRCSEGKLSYSPPPTTLISTSLTAQRLSLRS